MKKIELYDFTALRCPLVQSKKLGLEKIFSMVLHSTSVPQLQLLLGDTFSLLNLAEIWSYFHRFIISLNLFVSQRSWSWTSFCFRGFWFVSINPVFMSPGASFTSLSPIFISQSSLLSCWSASGSVLAALNSWSPVLLICFLHRLFISGSSLFLSPKALIYCQCFPCWFSRILFSHTPELLSRFWISLHISLHFVSSFISLFISIGSLLFVYFGEFWFVSLSLSPLSFLA